MLAASSAQSLPCPSHRSLQEDFVYEDMEALCSALRTLATDSNKFRAKADRRRQRSIFRAVLHYVEVCLECERGVPSSQCHPKRSSQSRPAGPSPPAGR